ncbi:FxSxx-COOH system tetratricopeptide repeat protein [Actinocrispum wychmicini]|uniref:FxSxx-COOH system tetratricopeptide repeat protein n=1 Tax=Actinocrispum wychmicini TaxID=1213861 RepID=UPI0024413E4D|nr:FxSxx-COOH system tetratricopeptide repeat protein [Actinocrispum wychmicini]
MADSLYLASIMDRSWRTEGSPSAEQPDADFAAAKRVSPPPADHPSALGTGDSGTQGKERIADHRPEEPVRDTAVADRHVAGGGGADSELRLVRGPRREEVVHAPVAVAAIVRALWPLKKSMNSWREDDLIFDAEATAERAVRDNLWWPVTKPDSQRLFDLTVVVDGSPSMTLWRSQFTALLSALENRGAFRTIQLRRLDTSGDAGGQPVLRGGAANALVRGSAELRDPSGRRMILVVTDGIAECWRQDLVGPVLARWGQTSQVCVVNLLPERMWSRTGMPVERVQLSQPPGVTPNRRWSCQLVDAWLRPKGALPVDAVPVPMVELEPDWLGWWARTATGGHRQAVRARALLTGAKPRPCVLPDETRSVREQVDHFRSVASPEAFRLATLLAAVPINVSIARMLQRELAPESGPEHLVEILVSGLVQPAANDAGLANWDEIRFHMVAAARALLLSGARRSATAKAIHVAASRFGDDIPQLGRLRDALRDPDTTPDPVLADEIAHDRVVMRALSGPYASRADRLNPVGLPEPTPSEPIQRSIQSPVTSRASPKKGSYVNRTDEQTGNEMPNTETAQSTDSLRQSAITTHAPPAEISAGEVSGSTETIAAGEARSPLGVVSQVADTGIEGIPPIWGNVPPRNLNFTGRAELLDQLSKRLVAGGTTAILPAALHGMGGIGKTQMAVEYIYRRLHRYDIVWWLQATQPAQIRAGLTELAQYMGLPGSQEAHTAVPAVREALRIGRPYRRWLLVFDSAESPDAVRPFFPTNGPGEILVTSRNPDWAGIARPLEVTVFRREESIELLRRRGPEVNNEDANTLADKLGDLPLAIEQAAAWRAVTGMPVAEYLRLFDEKVNEILDTSPATGYDLSVAAAWNVSFDELKNRNPAAHRLLQVCAFFAPEPISRDLFAGARGVEISPELDAALRDPMQLSRAIRDIYLYSLAKIDHRSNTLLLHRLVQAVLRNRMSPKRHADMRHGAHLLLANMDPRDPTSSKVWPRYQEVLPHIANAEVVECEDPWVRQLVINIGRFLYFWGDHQEAAALLKQALDNWSVQLGENDQYSLQAASFLGLCLWALGRFPEAAEINERTLSLRRQVSGENSEETILAELRVAADVKARGEFAAAREMNERIYQKAKGLYGEDDPITLQTAHDLAVTLRLCGDYRVAFDLDERTYQRRSEVLGYDNMGTLNTLTGLILDRQELGDYPRARVEHEQVAKRVREILGDDKADTLRRNSYLAVAKRKDGAHAEALLLSQETLHLSRQRYGDDHPNTMAAAIAHSIDLRHADRLEDARALGEGTFERYRNKLGEHHPHTLSAAVDLAVTLRLQGEAMNARQLTERSLEQFRVALGPDHPHAVVCMINLASDIAALKETEVAVSTGTEALERSKRVLGQDHPTTLAAALNLALDKRLLGATEESKSLYDDTVARYRKVLTDVHPATVAADRSVRADCDIDPLPG